jgi:ribose/xylose/arabinose/galactoside ABC-type transport system permease subunit
MPVRTGGRILPVVLGRNGILPPFFVALLLALAFAEPHFYGAANIVNVLRNASFLMIAASGQMLVLIVGGFDLSVGAVIALTSVVSASVMAGLPPAGVHAETAIIVLGVLAGLGCGFVVGLANALCVALLKVPPFMATLGTMSIANGVALLLTNGIPVYGMPGGYIAGFGRAIIFGVPVALYVAVIVVTALWFVQRFTRVGRYLYASGGNLQAAIVSGINVRLVLGLAYVLSSLLASLTGLLLTAEIGSGQASTGEALMLESIAAAVIAGTSLRGGVGQVELVALGAIFLLTLTNAMDLAQVDTKLQLIILGFVLILAVAAERLTRQEVARV